MWVVCIILLLMSGNVYAQSPGSYQPSTTLELRDEGVSQGSIKKLDCTGLGIVCNKLGVVGVINVAGGGGGSSITRISGISGVAGADITWQVLTANSVDVTTTTLSASVMTTTNVGFGVWKFKYTILYQTAATGTGIGFGVNHTGTATMLQAAWRHITTGGAAATGIGDNDTSVVAGQLIEGKSEAILNNIIGSTSVGVAVANNTILAVLEGVLNVSANGNIELKIASEVGGSAVRIMTGSVLELHKIS